MTITRSVTDISLAEKGLTRSRALGNLEVDRLISLTVEVMAEDKLTPVQARRNQDDGPCKARQFE